MNKLRYVAIICITCISIALIISISLLSGLVAEGEVGLDVALLTVASGAIAGIVNSGKKGGSNE